MPHDTQELEDQFFVQLARPRVLLELFDQLPGVYMYIKDSKSRYVRANRVVCDVIGVKNSCDVIGRSDFDFFPPAIAAQYIAEDQRVIASQKPLYNQVWFVPGKNGIPRLYLCNKLPLLDHQGAVAGIAGMKRPYEQTSDASSGYGRVLEALMFVSDHYHSQIEVSDLAETAQLSVSQLQREFSRLFGITPSLYIREVRVGAARHLLESSDRSLSDIAHACGFYDQSHFTRYFKVSTGLSPSKYRQRFQSIHK